MTTIGEAVKIVEEMNEKLNEIMSDKCSKCEYFRYDAETTCVCDDILDMFECSTTDFDTRDALQVHFFNLRGNYLKYHG